MNSKAIVFTDGASRGNPGPGGYGSVVVMGDRVVEVGGRDDSTTNNRMELRAAIEGLTVVKKAGDEQATVYSDSRYVINGITKWVFGWAQNGWKTGAKEDVSNRDLWEALLEVTRGLSVDWKYVGGHKGIIGNERCDEIATDFADKNPITLFDGNLSDYSLDILNIDVDESKAAATSASKSRKGAKAYSYVSKVDGEIQVHSSWPECEARVKGKAAKFKKALSAEDQEAIIAEFKK
jgi:ribonuclease HI